MFIAITDSLSLSANFIWIYFVVANKLIASPLFKEMPQIIEEAWFSPINVIE